MKCSPIARLPLSTAAIAATATAALFAGTMTTALADPTGPAKPKIDCTKAANKKKPECQRGYRGMTDIELYNAAYWLAQTSAHGAALDLLTHIRDRNDPKVLTAIGFSTRKLGDVDGAMPYYTAALALDPAASRTRSYLGEAYLSQGNLAAARDQLQEIERRCGRTCDGYGQLAARITAFETSPARRG